MSATHEQREIAPPENGTVHCPQCERKVGEYDAEHAQWFCRHCGIELVIKCGSVVLDEGGLCANVPGDKRSLLVALIAANLQCTANVQQLLMRIDSLPD